MPLAERALALLSEGQDAKNLARLRAELGRLQLTLDPPALEESRRNLEQAAADLAWTSAAPVDRAWIELGLARACFLSGDMTGTRELTASVLALADGQAPLVAAEAKSLEGQAHATEGEELAHRRRRAVVGSRPHAARRRGKPRLRASLRSG